jgi:hypothetical protein
MLLSTPFTELKLEPYKLWCWLTQWDSTILHMRSIKQSKDMCFIIDKASCKLLSTRCEVAR